jgi:LmbE family N-acetylglucosaminyl deacetylase
MNRVDRHSGVREVGVKQACKDSIFDFGGASVLIIAPHPDDEVIGCGGTIARVKESGGRVYVQYMTVGNVTECSPAGCSTVEQRVIELKQVATQLDLDGFQLSLAGDQYHLQLDRLPQLDLMAAIDTEGEVSMQTVKPDVVMVPSLESYNQDHRAVGNAALAVLRPSDGRFRHQPSVVLVYEELSDQWTGVATRPPDVFVCLDERHVAKKLSAMKLYESQYRDHPHSRSLRSLESVAILRGAQCGTQYAEAFQCLRWKV